jgi:futalosine hydrolase
MTSSPPPLVLLCSVPLEAEPVLDGLELRGELRVGRRRAWDGRRGPHGVRLIITGMGKTNAAQALTAVLESGSHSALGFGVAGSYPGHGPKIGGVVLAESAIYADEGVEAPAGWLSPREMGIPLLEVDGERYHDRFPLDRTRVRAAAQVLAQVGIEASVGPVATVSACSGTEARGALLARRHGAHAEAMEGAAWAHVARLYGAPYLEVRGISNRVEDRDPARWRLAEGAAAAAAAVLALIDHWDQIG